MTPSIEVVNVSKQYRVGQGLPSVKELFSRRLFARDSHWAVKDVSFALEPGEAVGIIGPNGAGKTTILKLLSQVTKPTSGTIKLNGRYSALIELGAGFHPDLTGRENIFLNGTILGMRHAEIKDRFDDIVEFAGIGQYLDTPVKRYSSGMYARLGFAIAAHVDPDILLVDEVLAVGDFAFQTRCHARMDELRRNGTSLIFVSHNMEAVRRVCDRGLVMYRGENIFQGTAAEAIMEYSNAVRQAARQADIDVPAEGGLSQRFMSFDAEIADVSLRDDAGRRITVLETGARVTLAIDVNFQTHVSEPIFAFFIRDESGRLIYNTTTRWMDTQTPDFAAGEQCRIEFDFGVPLLEGAYELGVDISSHDLSHYYDRLERALDFWVTGTDAAQGIVDLEARVTFKHALLVNGTTL